MSGKKPKKLDPLLQLFESYLLNRSYEDAEAFTKQLAQDYLAYLDSTSAHLPIQFRETVLEDLKSEAHELLVKKMYGCVTLSDYQNVGRVIDPNKTQAKDELDFLPEKKQQKSREKD